MAVDSTHAAGQLRARHSEGPLLIPVMALAWSSSGFFVISFVLCVLAYLYLPPLQIAHGALSIVLPGFEFNSWPRFFLGFAECFAWGWYIALIFAPLYNLLANRTR